MLKCKKYKYINQTKLKNYVLTICYVPVHFVHIVNLYVYIMYTLMNVHIIFSGLKFGSAENNEVIQQNCKITSQFVFQVVAKTKFQFSQQFYSKLVINLVNLFPVGLMKFRSIFQKEAYVSAFLISRSNLFNCFIVYSKKEFFKRQNLAERLINATFISQ